MGTGIKAKLYVNTGTGGYSTPTWTEVKIVGDCNLDDSYEKAMAPTRETTVVRGSRTTRQITFTGKILVPKGGHTNTAFALFHDAYIDPDEILDVLVLNGPKEEDGVTGVRFIAELTKWGEDQSLSNYIYKEFELIPSLLAADTELPQTVLVTSGAPVLTAIP